MEALEEEKAKLQFEVSALWAAGCELGTKERDDANVDE